MNGVYENFVVVALREALRVSERAFPQGNRGRRVSLEPDISWWEGGCTFVGDAKYEEAPPGSVNADLYQLLSYVVAAGLPGGLLVYGAGGVSAAHRVALLGRRLDVASLDLTEPQEGILRQVGEPAARIRSLRAQYLAAATAVSG